MKKLLSFLPNYHSADQRRPSFIKAIKNAIVEIDNEIMDSQNFLAESLD